MGEMQGRDLVGGEEERVAKVEETLRDEVLQRSNRMGRWMEERFLSAASGGGRR